MYRHSPVTDPTAAPSPRSRIIDSALLLLILCATAVISFLLYHHIYLNGSRFHGFTWHRAPLFPLIPLILLAALPVVIVELLPSRLRRPAVAIAILTLSCFALELTSSTLQNNTTSLRPIIHHTAHAPLAHGFFHDAEDLIATNTSPLNLLRTYPQRMPAHRYHVRNKGPLTILYYYTILRLVPDRDTAALIGALGLGLLASLAIPAAYYMLRSFDIPPDSAITALCAYTLMPAQLIFLPEFDTLYVPLTALLIAFWWRALVTNKKRCAIAAALTVSLTALFAFNTMIIGAFLIGLTILRRAPRIALTQIATATMATLAFHLLLYFTTGYNPITTFTEAWRQQHIAFHELDRPWPDTIPTDLTNFLYPLGFLPVILLISWFLHRKPPRLALAPICLALPIFIALTGLLPSESHRLWLFVIPPLLIPIALDFPHWPAHYRLTFYLSQTAVLIFITQNLKFH